MGFPSPPQDPRPPAAHGAVPPSVVTAARLMYAGAFLSLCGLLVAVLIADEVSAEAAEVSGVSENTLNGFVIGSGLVGGLITAALWLWIA